MTGIPISVIILCMWNFIKLSKNQYCEVPGNIKESIRLNWNFYRSWEGSSNHKNFLWVGGGFYGYFLEKHTRTLRSVELCHRHGFFRSNFSHLSHRMNWTWEKLCLIILRLTNSRYFPSIIIVLGAVINSTECCQLVIRLIHYKE